MTPLFGVSIRACPLLAALVLHASAVTTELDPRFFPPDERGSAELLQLRGLAEVFPGRVLFEDPGIPPSPVREEAARVEELPRGIRYIRVYRLAEALPVLRAEAGHPALLIDLRYLRSGDGGGGLASLLTGTEPLAGVRLVGDVPEPVRNQLSAAPATPANRAHPAVVLCNRNTGGPFEAVLQALQEDGSVIGVGEATAGRTAFHRRHDAGQPVWVQCGEVRPPDGTSLVGRGFIPLVEVRTRAEESYRGYFAYETGIDIRFLIRHGEALPETGAEGKTDDETDDDAVAEPDPVLQRGVDIIAALQVLGRMPDSN